jgi:multicomponent K+:H+ antiporter subunit A
MAFDVGVFLTVLGAVMLALAELSRMGRVSDPDVPINTDPMDIVTDGGAIRPAATKDS